MRPRFQPPRNKKFFHTKPKQDQREMMRLKKRIEKIHYTKIKKELETKEKMRMKNI